ncbi:MAG: SurA N-terminal domain-containing protein [Rikenellaceae bacterium]
MAALNTLRTKGGVALAVIIGLSLIAFLLGDLTNSSSTLFGSAKMNVGEIDGDQVSVQSYSNEIDRLSLVQQMLTGKESLSEQETNSVRSQAWDKIIRQRLFTESLEKLGLTVSADEQLDMVSGEFISPVLASIFVDRNTGAYDYEMVRNFVANIDYDPTGRAAAFWDYMEDEIDSDRAMSKYFTLIDKAIFVTDLEAKEYVSAIEKNSNIEFVSKTVYTLPDSIVTVTESDMKAYYNAHKNRYKQVENRQVEYVVFETLPSEKDYADAKEYVYELANEFSAATDLAQFVNLNSNSDFNPTFLKAEELSSELAAYAFTAKEGEIYGPVLKGDIYSMSRVVEVKSLPDSLGAKHILIYAGQEALADSLVTVLKKDKSQFASLASQFSIDQNANLSGGDLGIFHINMMIPDFSNAIAASKKGDIIKVDTQFGTHIVEVTMVGKKFDKAQIATVDYTVDPSNQTSQIVYSNATNFASQAKVKGADFDVVASENGSAKRVARLSAGDREIQGITGSTEVVRWIFDNEEGSISPVISVGDKNVIVRVVKCNEFGPTPYEDVKSDFRNTVFAEKKAEYLKNQLSGVTSLEEAAKILKVEVTTAENVSFRTPYIQGIGMAPKVVGAVSNLGVNQTSTPIYSAGSINMVKVVSQNNEEGVSFESEKALLQATAETSYQQRAMAAIYSLGSVKDSRIKFF